MGEGRRVQEGREEDVGTISIHLKKASWFGGLPFSGAGRGKKKEEKKDTVTM